LNLLELAIVVVASYLVGAIPMGYIAGRVMKGVDIRDYGSGKIGATNVLRVLGYRPFIGVMVADALKGYIPVLVTWYVFNSGDIQDAHALQVASGIAAVLGHDYPVYIGFRGGRGWRTGRRPAAIASAGRNALERERCAGARCGACRPAPASRCVPRACAGGRCAAA